MESSFYREFVREWSRCGIYGYFSVAKKFLNEKITICEATCVHEKATKEKSKCPL
uniref:hypothetical protein n=1 Tax=Agathobacter sp. TaxID=2021311 RepID=UPI00405729AD